MQFQTPGETDHRLAYFLCATSFFPIITSQKFLDKTG